MTDINGNESFFAQLKQRRVVRVAIAYAAAVFVALQVADVLFPALGLSDRAVRLLLIGSLIGFPVVLALAWIFQLTPEGLRLASREGRVVVRLRPWMMYASGGVLLVVLLAGAALWVRPHLLASEVTPGADVIAVVPFTTSGPGVEAMGEGLVDLLSRNLDEVGAIRTVDPRTVLHRWRQRSADGGLTGPEILAIGREVNAGSVLSGAVVAAGGQVRITADLLGLDGSRLATATVDGEEYRVLELVDSLSVLLLTEIWRGRGPVPGAEISAISTSNLTAIRAFLAGEQYYRQSDWPAAREAYDRAVEADSTFALAYYRLSRVAGWYGEGPATREAYVELAARHSDRLPVRARVLVMAERLSIAGEENAAIDTLRALAERYPDDPEVWQSLADAEFHRLDEGQMLGARPIPEQLAGFERVLELDPGFVPAMIHPLEIAFAHGDTGRIRKYAGLLNGVPAVSQVSSRTLSDAVAAMWDPDDLVGLISALSVSMRNLERGTHDLGWQIARAAFEGLRRRAATLPAGETATIIQWLESQLREDEQDYGTHAIHLLADLLISSGRMTAATELLQSAHGRRLAPPMRWRYAAVPSAAGFTDTLSADTAGALSSDPAMARLQAAGLELVGAIDRRDVPGVEAVARRLERPAASAADAGRAAEMRAAAEALAAVARGFARALDDGPVDGLESVEQALGDFRDGPALAREALWFRWLERMAATDETRGRALEDLRRVWPGQPAFEVRRWFLLGRALEAEGETEAARRAFARYVSILAAADSDLAIAREIEQARDRAAASDPDTATAQVSVSDRSPGYSER